VEAVRDRGPQTGNLELLSNVVDGARSPAAHDPHQLRFSSNRGEGIKPTSSRWPRGDRGLQGRVPPAQPGADIDKITDEELLREVMNTVGRRGNSASRSDAWQRLDAYRGLGTPTRFTHILGLRAFRSQLLCSRFVAVACVAAPTPSTTTSGFDPEYANVYGIPFQFISSTVGQGPVAAATGAGDRRGRGPKHLRITYPVSPGTGSSCGRGDPLDLDSDPPRDRTNTVPRLVELQGLIGTGRARPREYGTIGRGSAFALAKRILETSFNTADDKRPWLYLSWFASAATGLSTRCTWPTGTTSLPDDDHEAQAEAAELSGRR